MSRNNSFAAGMQTTAGIDTGGKPADPYTDKNLENPPLKDKIEDMVTFVEKCKFCMMTTRIATSGLLVSRCMALAAKEGHGVDLLFHANAASGKMEDLHSDPDVNLGFLNSSGEWCSISGRAALVNDRESIHKYYSPALKAWVGDLGDGKHDGGPDDPRIVLIKVNAVTAQYSVAKKGILGGAVEMAKGVAHGEPPAVNKLRYLNEEELEKWRKGEFA